MHEAIFIAWSLGIRGKTAGNKIPKQTRRLTLWPASSDYENRKFVQNIIDFPNDKISHKKLETILWFDDCFEIGELRVKCLSNESLISIRKQG